MRYIDKKEEPPELKEWKKECADELSILYKEGTGKDVWRLMDIHRKIYDKKRLKEYLLREQGFICCYCGKRLSIEKIEHTSIEHLNIKSEDKSKTYDYFNLLASCLGGSRIELHKVEAGETLNIIADKYEVSVEHLQDAYILTDFDKQKLKEYNLYDLAIGDRIVIVPLSSNDEIKQHCNIRREAKPISVHPLKEDVAKCFRYDRKGQIFINTDNRLSVTNLGLNDNILLTQDRRKLVLEADRLRRFLFGRFGSDKNDFRQKVKEFAAEYEKFDVEGKLKPFCFVTVSALQDY